MKILETKQSEKTGFPNILILSCGKIKTTYRTTFKVLVLGELPSEGDLVNT